MGGAPAAAGRINKVITCRAPGIAHRSSGSAHSHRGPCHPQGLRHQHGCGRARGHRPGPCAGGGAVYLPAWVPRSVLPGEPGCHPPVQPAASTAVLPGSSSLSSPTSPSPPRPSGGPDPERALRKAPLAAPRTVTQATHACPAASTWAPANAAAATATPRSVSPRRAPAR